MISYNRQDSTYKDTINTWALKIMNDSADKCEAESKRLAERATKKIKG